MKSFKAAAPRHGRIVILSLLSLLILSLSGISPAHADSVVSTIGNGQTVYGNISYYTKYDTYTFSAGTNDYIFFSIGEFGAHDTNFFPEIYVYKPSSALWSDTGDYYNSWLHGSTSTYSGTWSIKVTRGDGYMTGGDYYLQMYILPGPPVSIFGGSAGGMMYPSNELCRHDQSRRHRLFYFQRCSEARPIPRRSQQPAEADLRPIYRSSNRMERATG